MKSSDKALQEFFTALLEENKPAEQLDAAPLQKLLDGVAQPELVVEPVKKQAPTPAPVAKVVTATPPADETIIAPIIAKPAIAEPSDVKIDESERDSTTNTELVSAPNNALTEVPPIPDEEFQALYFQVAGMTLAVPLEQLGGIHSLDEEQVSSLIGKPGWFKGLLAHRERKLNVVDTALWVMPEKYDEKLAEQLNYQYLVMLKDSDWGLACEKLITTSQLMPSAVNWRTTMGKRPWLRGMVKEQMCALLNVDALIELLNTGMNSQQANNPE